MEVNAQIALHSSHNRVFLIKLLGARMGAIWRTVSSPLWVVTTVVVGVLLNLVSSYLKDATDRLLKGFSRRRGASMSARNEKRLATLRRLRRDDLFRVEFRTAQIEEEQRGYLYHVMALIGAFSLFMPMVTSKVPLGVPLFDGAYLLPYVWRLMWFMTAVAVVVGFKFKMSATDRSILLAATEDHRIQPVYRHEDYTDGS